MTITILSREVITATVFQPWDIWKFYISASDAAQVLYSHTSLEITTSLGVKKASLTSAPWSEIYTTATVDPYNLSWSVQNNGGGSWSLNFIKPFNAPGGSSPAFTNINDWTTFEVDSTVSPPVSIDVTQTPQALTPAYNPVTFRFSSPQYNEPGFRYLVNVYAEDIDETGTTIGSFDVARYKVAPLADGTGYIDISKAINNLVSVDFSPEKPLQGWVPNTLVKYSVGFGVEFINPWSYTNYSTRGTGPNANRMVLTQSPALTPHTFVVGDQLNVDTTVTSIRGLQRVIEVPDAYSIVIDVVYTGVTQPIPGVVNYADSRSIAYPDIPGSTFTGAAFNGARDWLTFPQWIGNDWTVTNTPGASRLLTSLKPKDLIQSTPDQWIYMKPWQSYSINFYVDDPDATYRLRCTYNGSTFLYSIEEIDIAGNMKGFKIGFNQLSITPIAGVPLEFAVVNELDQLVSDVYQVYPDLRCSINEYELIYMDRMGSLLSMPFSLRDRETGMVERKTFKRALDYNQTSTSYTNVYNTEDSQVVTYNISYDKELELNSDWMNDGMSTMFEELMTSPYVWIKVLPDPLNPGEIKYLACEIKETNFEIERQKNKRLIRKTVKVKLSNQNIVNI